MSSEIVPATPIPLHPERRPQITRDTVDGWLPMFEPVARLATEIAQTEFIPAGLRGKPAAIVAAILYGREIGLGPIQSLQSIDVIDGRPAVSAEMGRALALAAGHELFIEESTTTRCVVRGRRSNSREWVTVTWTMDDAKRAGLDGRPNYRKHPRRMLQARATSELCHLLFSDALGGMPFTLEEIADDSDAAGQIGTERPARTAQRSRRAAPVAAAPTDPPKGDDPPLPGDEGYGDDPGGEDAAASRSQISKLQILFKALGVEDRKERLAAASSIVRRELASSNDLTKEEARILIDTLEQVSNGPDPAARLAGLLDATPAAGGAEPPTELVPREREDPT